MSETVELPGLVSEETVAVGAGEGEALAPAAHLIGIDASLTSTGMADGSSTWRIVSSGSETATLSERRARLTKVARAICAKVPTNVDLVLIEGPSPKSKFGHPHDRSGLWWLVVNSLMAAGVPVVEVSPSSLKKYATGNGNASKELVVDATARRYPHVQTGANTDRCDAHWLAAIGEDWLTGAHVVPESHRTGLVNIHWPAGLRRHS